MKSGVVLDIWVMDLTFPGYMKQCHRLAREFEAAHPGYEVAITGPDMFNGAGDIAEAIARGRCPAAAEYHYYLTQVARDSLTPDGHRAFYPMEKAIDGRAEILGEPVIMGDIIPPMREWYTCQGELPCLPSAGTTSVLYANTDLLSAAGVTTVPRTWAEVAAACEATGQRLGSPGITWANHAMFAMSALASQGGRLANHDDGHSARATAVDLASLPMLTWASWWQRLHADGCYLYTGKIPDWAGTFREFAEQNVAMRMGSSNDTNYTVEAAKQAGFALGVGGYPYNDEVSFAGNELAGTSFWLADRLDTVTRDGVLAFLQFAHNPRNAAQRHKDNSFVPLTHAAVDLLDTEGWFGEHPYHRVPTDQLRRFPGRAATETWPPCSGPMIGGYAGIQDILTGAMHDVLTAGADPAVRLRQATSTAQDVLDRYNAECAAGSPRSAEHFRVEFFTGAEPFSGVDLHAVVRPDR
jgi:sn-glycerol 3-phosphate transport system substrate-binding protein